jgi:hypothetical protein
LEQRKAAAKGKGTFAAVALPKNRRQPANPQEHDLLQTLPGC